MWGGWTLIYDDVVWWNQMLMGGLTIDVVGDLLFIWLDSTSMWGDHILMRGDHQFM